ncbi:hypothetical protein BC939DRAFT_458789 [Gamsiella multidivaricata]|uniref:uncharacterized protein n=1 Tax=Gamsiella multidivaricata TaxID=101098 RepID=UPI00221F445A|nr:uncharacterized protein BC939DRAFT_458789 [Gamsiella multidivaricata]KAI7820045.1 hypothetical protein BC939DRAFT_458789 [Gamsiella multidivaricata]
MASAPRRLSDSASSSAPLSSRHQNYGSVTAADAAASEGGRMGAGTGDLVSGPWQGSRNSTVRRSVLITVPDQDDNASVSSRSSFSTYSSSCSSTDSLLPGKHRTSSSGKTDVGDVDNVSSRQLFWTYVALSPILLSIWVVFAALLLLLPSVDNDSIVRWDRFVVGMVGWAAAFASRRPLFSLFYKVLHIDGLLCELSTLFSAGLLEEIIRLGIITALSIEADFGAVYWLGLGWSGIETLYYIGQSLVYTRWISDDDYRSVLTSNNRTSATSESTAAAVVDINDIENGVKDTGDEDDMDTKDRVVAAQEARHLLGIDRPWWSLMGRTSSMMVHIGLCCWLGYSGWKLLLPAALIHGILYVIWGVLMPDRWSVPATSYGTLMAAMGIFLIGLALYGEII